jgi:hypothetical protein
MKITLPSVVQNIRQVQLASTITSGKERQELWYSIPSENANWFSADRCDGFVVGLLFQAMERNENMIVEGPMSSRLFHNLQNFFIPMMARAFPNLHPVKITPASLIDERADGRGVVTGFSGGIDSFATVIQHFAEESSPGHRITHFLFHNAGSHGHGKPEDARQLFWHRYQKAQSFAQELGIPLIPVDSNLAEVFPIGFIRMHSALNASIPLLLQNQFLRYYYASTYKYADCGVSRADDIGRFDPFAFHLFSTEGLDCVSTGSQMSRVEKTKRVAAYEPSYRHLNVCVDPAFEGRNCSVCFKCCRTLLTLELLGMAHLYKDVFDLEEFNKVRRRYGQTVLLYKRGSFEAEISDLFREKGSGLLAGALRLRHMWDKMVGRP